MRPHGFRFRRQSLPEPFVASGLGGESVDSRAHASLLLELAKSQQTVKTSFGKVLCELKAAKLDFPSSVPKTGLYRQ
jgi:hypothetical protein